MTNLTRALAVAFGMTICSSIARAQQYRVDLVVDGGMITHADFRPCAAGLGKADCGASISTAVRADGTEYGLATQAISPDGRDSVTVDRGELRIKALDGRRPAEVRLGMGNGLVRGIAISPDSRYAFAVVEHAAETPSSIVMVDLATQDAVSAVGVNWKVLGIALPRE